MAMHLRKPDLKAMSPNRLTSSLQLCVSLPIVLLIIYLVLVASGFSPYLTDQHGFRQTQTAIAARYFSGFADFLSYQLPVLGPPWAIPLEFPLYQALAKGLNVASGISLESSGRVVSIAFFLACFWPMHHLLRAFSVTNTPLVMASVLLAPLYVFWSRSFMIETTALFFSLSYVASFVRIQKQGDHRVILYLILVVSGCLAALVKITTVLPLLMVTAAVTAWLLFKNLRRRESWTTCAGLAVSQAVVLGVAVIWVSHTDAIRAQNLIGAGLTSNALRSWNFGTLAQRLDPTTWKILLDRSIDVFLPMPDWWHPARQIFAALTWIGFFGYLLSRCTGARRLQIIGLLGLFLLPFLVFTNLHYVHNYYQTANAVFLCLAFGVATYGAIEALPSGRTATSILLVYFSWLTVFAVCSALSLRSQSNSNPNGVELANVVQKLSPSDSVIVVTGLDWSSELPYQSARRALMLTEWMVPTAAKLNGAMQALRFHGITPSLYIACGGGTWLDIDARRLLNLLNREPVARVDRCSIYSIG
jgi:hypothetical protein